MSYMVSKKTLLGVALVGLIVAQPAYAGYWGDLFPATYQVTENIKVSGNEIALVVAGTGVFAISIVLGYFHAKHVDSKLKKSCLEWFKHGQLTRADFKDQGVDKIVKNYAKHVNEWHGPEGIKNLWKSSEVSRTTLLKD